jgi:hypothetical protein
MPGSIRIDARVKREQEDDTAVEMRLDTEIQIARMHTRGSAVETVNGSLMRAVDLTTSTPVDDSARELETGEIDICNDVLDIKL